MNAATDGFLEECLRYRDKLPAKQRIMKGLAELLGHLTVIPDLFGSKR